MKRWKLGICCLVGLLLLLGGYIYATNYQVAGTPVYAKKLVQGVVTIAADDTTPDVSGGLVFVTSANTGATAITDLDNPTVNQLVRIVGGSNTNPSTIADSGNFNLDGAWTANLDSVLALLVQADNDYIEVSRSIIPGASGDMQKSTYDTDTDDLIDQANGGTELDTSGVTNGQLLIGNTTGNAWALATLTDGEGIDSTLGASSIQIDGEDATDANKGIASFASADFDVSSGAVSIKDDSIVEAYLKATNTAADEDILTYESTVGDFEWHTPAELNLQPLDAGLTDISGLAVTDGNFIVGDGANWVAETGNTARTSLGLGTGDSPTFTSVTATGRFVNSTITTFTDADATPTVAGTNVFKTANTGATSITAFDDGTSGQPITIIFGDANTTITDGANLHLQGGIDFTSTADDTMELVYDGTSWFETDRSVN